MRTLFFFFFSFLLLVLLPVASAIGVAPGSIRLTYEEGEVVPFEMRIINQGDSKDVQMYLQGWLRPYVTLSEDTFSFEEDQRLYAVNGTLTMPPYDSITEYGPQRIFVGAKDVAPDSSGGITAVAAVKMWIEVDIPFPGKYARLELLQVDNVLEGENTDVRFVVLNRGTNALSDAKIVLSLKNLEGEELASKTFENIFIPVDNRETIDYTFLTQDLESGIYSVKATFFYDDGNSLDTEETFFIGTSDVILTDYTDSLKKGEVNRINLTLQSIWGSPLTNIRLTIKTADEEFSLPVVDLSSFEKKVVKGFIDVPSLEEDILNASLHMLLPVDEGVVAEKETPLSFTLINPPRKELSLPLNTTTLLFIVSGVLLLVLVLNVFFFGKKKDTKKKQGRQKK